jgi:tetratricopeptide (TPR) repeat protein
VLQGRYEVGEEIGQGGMGVVYRAHDRQLGRDVAIKLVLTTDDPDEMHAARLMREAQALAQLSHPNVVAVYDVGRTDGGVFVAMELIAGVAGDAWLKEKRPWRDVVRVYRDAARGLAAAHARGLVHRDFKPANLMIGEDGRVRVLDFGLARTTTAISVTSGEMAAMPVGEETPPSSDKSASLLDVALTQIGALVGTPPYMAPEQHRRAWCDARSDQFSFCAALYRSLYNQRPFEGATYGELKGNVLAGRVRPPPAGTDVPAWVHAIIMRGLAVDPAARWPSMDPIITALGRDPDARRRKAFLGAGAALLAIGAGAVMWRVERHDPAAVCRGGEDQLAGVWDGTRKAAVAAAFNKTGKPYAQTSLAAVTRALDTYTTSWVAMRSDACLATHERGTQSAELLDLRMECLQRRLDDARAFVDVLVAADADVVARAAEAAGALPPLAGCADADALRAPVPLPADKSMRVRVDTAHKTLAAVRALWIAGRYADAQAAVAPVVAEAHALGWRPLEGEALLASARLADTTGDYPAAAQQYKDAAIAAEAGRDDETAALANNGLVWVTGERLGHYAEAQDMAREAAAKIERLGRRDVLQADLDQKVAALLLEQGKYPEAEARSKHVLEIRQKVLPPDDPAIATALGDLGDVAQQMGRQSEAIDDYEKALAVAEKSVGPDHPLCASLRINLSSVFRTSGKNAEAREQLDRARSITEHAFGPDHPQLATVALDTGDLELAQGHLVEAAAQFHTASEIFTRALGADHPNVATAQFHLGEIALKQNHPADAAASFKRALEIWQAKLGPDHPSIAVAESGLGDAAMAQKQPAAALAHYQRSLAVLEKSLGPNDTEIADALISVATAQSALGESTQATASLDRALALREAAGDANELARTRFVAAKVLATLDAKARAVTLANQAAQVLTGADHDEVVEWLRAPAHGGSVTRTAGRTR